MISSILSIYSFRYPQTIIFMLQSTEYQVGPYLAWFWRTQNFSNVAKRRNLDRTKSARLLLLTLEFLIVIQLLVGALLILQGINNSDSAPVMWGIACIIAYPIVSAHLITLPLIAARLLIAKPKEKRLVKRSKQIFNQHQAIIIAVAGSYGKTTVKELLLTILSEGKKVAATPANKNVAVSHAKFASKLTGDEEVLVIEYGEGQPGDVAKFAIATSPSIGFITGLAPAHLDKYKTLDAAAKDIMSLANYVEEDKLYINADSPSLKKYIKPGFNKYSSNEVDGWKVSDESILVQGMEFTLTKGKRKLRLATPMIGEHLIGPLAACVAIAAKLGLSDKQIIDGVAKTQPFEHRMQPRMLAGGWIIDDTYNGNLEGIRAGLDLLSHLDARQKTYVTPGLVDQGREAHPVHLEVGRLIAKANPDTVVLMKNSVTKWIKDGLKEGDYKGEVVVEDDPLHFYTNLDQISAAGDVIMMQNDWTDNYN